MLKRLPRFDSPANSIRIVVGLICCASLSLFVACKSDYQGSTRQNRPGDAKAARQAAAEKRRKERAAARSFASCCKTISEPQAHYCKW